MSSDSTCSDYECEGGVDHSHVGVRSNLRRVMNPRGQLVDGKTGLPPDHKVVEEPAKSDDDH